MTPGPASPPSGGKDETRDAVVAFEEILADFPNDTATLDALCQSYLLLGEQEKARRYLVRLIRVMLDQGDEEGAASNAELLASLAGDDPEAGALRDRLRLAVETMPEIETSHDRHLSEPAPAADPFDRRDAMIEAETELAARLKAAGVLSEEEHAALVRDLDELAGHASGRTVSALHVLHDRASAKFEPAFAFILRESRCPLAPLDSVEPDEPTRAALPLETVAAQGLCVFDHIEDEWLAAALNPLRDGLRESLESRLRRRVHLFAARPDAFDRWIERAQAALAATDATS